MLSLLLGKWRLLSGAARAWLIVGAISVFAGGCFSAGWKVAGWRHDAAVKSALEAQAEEFREQLADAAIRAADERRRARNFSLELTQIRRERDIALRKLLGQKTLTRTVTKVIHDDTPCTCDALGTEFRLFFNAPLEADRNPETAVAD